MSELYLHSSNTPPWHGAQLKHRDFTFTDRQDTYKQAGMIIFNLRLGHNGLNLDWRKKKTVVTF
jgi:hypothetical protein